MNKIKKKLVNNNDLKQKNFFFEVKNSSDKLLQEKTVQGRNE
jgi:hypothetical protein